MDAGSTTIGGCGDINRNVMAPPVPMVEGAPPAYRRAGAVAAICAELFVPQTEAFSEIWCDGDKLASVQYWKRHLVDAVTGGGTPTVENFAKADELRVDEDPEDADKPKTTYKASGGGVKGMRVGDQGDEDRSNCSCIEGNPCAVSYNCKDWNNRFEVAKANGWKGF